MGAQYPQGSGSQPPPDGSVTDAKVAANAAIAESKLALASDAAAGTASRRSLGTSATQATAGNDSRLSNARTPTAHASSHSRVGADALTTLDGYYQPQMPNMLAAFEPGLIGSLSFITANRLFLTRVIAPKAGTLHDVAIFIGATSGHIRATVYDTGDALAGNLSLLWDSGSVLAGTTNTWQVVGDPALTVTAGQQIYLGIQPDNTTVTFGMTFGAAANVSRLPANFWPSAGGATPFVSCFASQGSFTVPATISDPVGLSAGNAVIGQIARVS